MTKTKDNQIIIILGVHRSGTSLTARIINSLGVSFGDRLIPGRSDNPSGFFEHRDIVEQTRSLDKKLGIDPFGSGLIVPVSDNWWHDPEIAQEKQALKDILNKEDSGLDHLFGFKDPRTLYLLPLWQEIFKDLGLYPEYVLSLRRPTEVRSSMAKRGVSPDRAGIIWLAQLTAGLSRLDQGPAAVVDFDRWFMDPVGQAGELVRSLDIFDLDSQEIEDRLKDVVKTGNRHHIESKDSEVESDLSESLYQMILDYGQGSRDWSEVRSQAEWIDSISSLYQPLISELGQRPNQIQAELEKEKDRIRELQEQMNRMTVDRSRAGLDPVDRIAPRHPEPYKAQFPGLSSIKALVKSPGRALKVCIATEDIVGPIRNGGIGTTYTHLALLLAEAGHDVTIVFIRGEHCEDGEIGKWVEWYRQRGVGFVPLPEYGRISSPADRWLQPMYSLYEYLKKEPFDLVHASEWRGSSYLCLLAKRQGLAFKDTIFCIKSSSPWLWNREVQLQPLELESDLVKMYAERRSIELADLVVGGSAYLLRWMLDHGYHLPKNKTFVQPNVLKPVDLPQDTTKNRPEAGTRVTVNEIVFFGRLEHRKGLDIFCQAVSLLIDWGVELSKITFMGKFGARMPGHQDKSVAGFIRDQAGNWPVKYQILDNYNQIEALSYLQGQGRLAVMPSRIENSTLTVYETTHFRIPFIASNVGGTPELIKGPDRREVLTRPHPVPLARKLKKALEDGAFVAAPSFDNQKNLGQWLNFHSNMSIIKDHGLWPPESIEIDYQSRVGRSNGQKMPITTACLVLKDNVREVARVINVLFNISGDLEIVLVDDGSQGLRSKYWIKRLEKVALRKDVDLKVFRQQAFGPSWAKNFAADKAIGDYLLFVDPGTRLRPDCLEVLSYAAANRCADLLLPIYDDRSDKAGQRVVFLAGDPNFGFFDPSWRSPLVYVRKEAFDQLGGFSTDYKVPAATEEFLIKAVLAGRLVETVPEPLAEYQGNHDQAGFDQDAALMRTVRPYTAAAPLCYQPLFLMARSLGQKVQLLRQQNEGLRMQRDARKEDLNRLQKRLNLFWRVTDKIKRLRSGPR